MKTLIGLFIFLFSIVAHAQKFDGEWNWYYAAFYSPSSGSDVLLRHGTATVRMSQSEISLQFVEKDFPEMRATFRGQIIGSGDVRGVLKGFFPSDSDRFLGTFRELGKIKSCRWQEIILRPSVPDGSVLVLSRVGGPCQ